MGKFKSGKLLFKYSILLINIIINKLETKRVSFLCIELKFFFINNIKESHKKDEKVK